MGKHSKPGGCLVIMAVPALALGILHYIVPLIAG